MNKKTHKKYVALLTMFAMVVCTLFCTNTAKANTALPWSESEVADTSTCVVDGIERSLIILTNNNQYLKIGNDEPIYLTNSINPFKFDQYGTLWCIETDNVIYWKSYDFGEIDVSYAVRVLSDEGDYWPIEDVESFIFDSENEFVIGFKLSSGDSFYTYTSDEIQSILASDRNYYPDLKSISSSSNTPTPSTNPGSDPTPTPSTTPQVTPSPTPVVTPEPTVAPDETPAPSNSTKVTIKKKSGFTCLYTGTNVTSQYKLKKGTLTWKSGSKTKKIKGVKSAGFIKKSKNLIYMTKKGKVFTISSKGKKKTIVKKGAKKLVVKNKYVIKVKTKSGSVNVTKK